MKNVKRALALVLVLALALSMAVMGAGAVKYSDVADDYAYSTEIQFLSDLDILTGYTDGTFGPEKTITRAEAAAVIFRTLAGKQSAGENYQGGTIFSDVAAEHWASGYINFCTELGIINGYPDGTFKPEQTINYGEYVTMLVRALGLDVGKDLNYPFGYIAEATVEGVNLGVDLSAANDCPRGAVAKLTYNAILDATYKRIANNIYVTEKPTIAKDVLKLQLIEGVMTGAEQYDFSGANAPGKGKFRVSDITSKVWIDEQGLNVPATFEYDVDTSLLGKGVKVWYKPDAVTASGDKVYAVIGKAADEKTLGHISLKGALKGNENELTYAVDDVDKTLKLADDCRFIENNEFLGQLTDGEDNYTAIDFYPAAARCWLPVSYNFIDNDKDGKYDFVIRTAYGFGEVINLTSSEIQVEGKDAIDLKDDDGNAYAWNDALADVASGDYVLYYADGALTEAGDDADAIKAALTNGPTFESDSLYFDSYNASFQKIEPVTGELEGIVDHDKFTFDGKTFRLLNDAANENPDLNLDAAIGDEYEYYPLAAFGIIAKSELITKSTGKYLLVTQKDDAANLGGNFDILGVNENGKEEVYTVKSNDKKNLNVYVNGKKDNQLSGALDFASVKENVLYEYSTDSAGRISSLKEFTGDYQNVEGTVNGLTGYNKNSRLLKVTNDGKTTASYYIADNTLVYISYDNDSEYKVYTGGFPKLTKDNGDPAPGTVVSLDMDYNSSSNKVKAVYVSAPEATSTTGVSAKENVTGYLRSIRTDGNNTDGWYYEYTIAYDGDLSAKFRSATVADQDDLSTLIDDYDLIDRFSPFAGGVVGFDIQPDGTIANMDYKGWQTADNADKDAYEGGKYYGTYMLVDYDKSNNTITVVPIENGVNLGAKKLTGDDAVSNEDILAEANAADRITFTLTSDAKIVAFDIGSSNQANVTNGTLLKPTVNADDEITKGYLISFGYDDEDELVTNIFINNKGAIE